jgi:hypothetical protein
MPLLINLLPFPILIWCRVRQIVLELHNLASAANCHIPQCRIKCLLSKLTLYRHVPRVPPSPGLALSSRDCSYVILVAIHARNSEDHRCLAPSASLFSPSSTASNLDTNSHSLLPPPGRPRSNCTAESCLGCSSLLLSAPDLSLRDHLSARPI